MPSLSFDVFWRDHGAREGLRDTADGADRAHDRMGLFTAGAAAGASAAAGALFALGTNAKNVANDIAESTSKIGVVFGDTAKSIMDFGETSAESLGISKRSALEAAGTFGNLLVSLKLPQEEAGKMSLKMISLAADMASFNNASPEEALDAIRSGLLGETEPLLRFGVAMNDATLRTQALEMGLIKSVKEGLDPAQKAQAAYGLILASTSTAQGDFARTQDGAANQARIAKARFEDLQGELGEKLLPVVVKAGAALLDVADYLEQNSHWLVPVAAGIVALAIAVWGVNAAATAYAATQAALNVVMALNPIGLVVIAIGLLVAGLVIAYKKSETFREIVNAAFTVVAKKALDMGSAIIGGLADALGWIPGLGPKLQTAAEKFDQFKTRVNNSLNGINDEGVNVSLNLRNNIPRTLYGIRIAGGQGSLRGGITMATGGAVRGPGTGTSDEVPIWGSNGEHMWTAAEVRAAGGHSAVESLRRSALGRGPALPQYAEGGPIMLSGMNAAMRSGANTLGAASARAVQATAARALESVLGSATLGNGGWQRQWAAVRSQFPSAQLTSSFRPGSRTVSGNQSYHALGRAIDVSPSMAIFNWLVSKFGRTSKEIIYSPANGRQIHNGRQHMYTGAVRRMHYNHVHWAYDQGGMLAPGYSSVYNGTGRPERILSARQTDQYDSLVRATVRSGGAMNGSPGAEAIDYARLGDSVARAFTRAGVSVSLDGTAVGRVMGRTTSIMERA